jgi:hypothetical protein
LQRPAKRFLVIPLGYSLYTIIVSESTFNTECQKLGEALAKLNLFKSIGFKRAFSKISKLGGGTKTTFYSLKEHIDDITFNAPGSIIVARKNSQIAITHLFSTHFEAELFI